MAARWGTRSRKRSISTMEFFTGVSPLQCHPLEEDGGISDLGLPPLDACDLLGTFRGYIDPSIISIIEGAGNHTETKGRFDDENELSLLTALTEILDNADDDENLSPFDSIPDSELLVSQRDRDLHKFLCLSRSPPDRNHLPVDDFKGFKIHGNGATFGKVENRAEDGWSMFPDCLSSTPARRSKAKSVRKGIQRVQEVSTLQLSDGEEKVCSPEHDTSSESSVDFVDFGMDFEELSTGSALKPKASASKHGTPHTINTANVSLADLVKFMHSYCLPNQTVIDSGNSETDETFLSNGEMLEIEDCLSVPVFLVNSSPEFPDIIAVENICPVGIIDSNINCTPVLAKEALPEDEAAKQENVNALPSTLSELGSKATILTEEPISNSHSGPLENHGPLQAKADKGLDKSIEKPGVANVDGVNMIFVKAEEAAPKPVPELDDSMPLLEPEPTIAVSDCVPGMEKQIPALHPQPTSVVDWLGLPDEACKPQHQCGEMNKIPVLKQEYLIGEDELKKQVRQTGPEVGDMKNTVQVKTETSDGVTERQVHEMVDGLSLKACSLNQTNGSHVSDLAQVQDETELISPRLESIEKPTENVMINTSVFSTLSKRKCHGHKNLSNDQKKKEMQNVKSKQVDILPKLSLAPQLSEIADGENTQLKVSFQGTSCLNNPSLKESDLLMKQLEQAKRESEMELKLLKASRAIKSRARNHADSSFAMNISEKKNSPVTESEAEQCKLETGSSLLVPITDPLENVKPSLTCSREFNEAEPVPLMEVNEPSKASSPPIDVDILKEQVKGDADVAKVLQEDPVEVKGEKSALTGEENDPGQSKDIKPKLLSLTEYRMRMQHRKTNAEEDRKENENLMSNKWPSIPEPPTELAEIPCLMKPKVPEERKGTSAKNKVCQQPFMRDSPESPDQEPYEIAITTKIPLDCNSDNTRAPVCIEKTFIETAPVATVSGCIQPVCAVYAEAPTPPWPPISPQSTGYPFLPSIPPPTFSPNAFPPLPIPPSQLLSWPPPFPPPPVGTAPFPTFPPGWVPCIPPPPLPPPPYWHNIPLPPPTVPPPMFCDGGPPLHCPPGFPYPPNVPIAPLQGAEYSLTNAVNLSQPSIRSMDQKAPSTSYQKSPDVFKNINLGVLNHDAHNPMHGQKSTDFGIPVVHPVVSNYVKPVSSAPVQACQNQIQASANKIGRQVCNPEKPTQQATEMKVQTICAPKPENSSRLVLQTLINNQAGTKGTVVKQLDPRSTNELVLKIFELLRKAQKQTVQVNLSDTMNPPVKETAPSMPPVPRSGQTVLPSILQHSSAGQETVLSMTLKPYDPSGLSVHPKQESVVDTHASHKAAASLMLRVPATEQTVLPMADQPQIALSLTGQPIHPGIPLEKPQALVQSMVLKPQPAVPTIVLKPQVAIPSVGLNPQTVQTTVLKSQIAVLESQTTLRLAEVLSVKLEPQPLLSSATLKPQDVVASMVVQSTTSKPQAVVSTEALKPQIAESRFSGVQEKKMKKCKVSVRKRGIVGKEKAIEACDLTSLLEQFEKSEAKEEKHCSQSPGDNLAVANSRLKAEVESKSDTLLVMGLGSTAELTPPATPPHQPHSSVALLGKSSILNTALREGSNNVPMKRMKLIDAQPLPQNRHRRPNSLLLNDMPQSLAVHVGFGDHDYCFLQDSQSETLPDATQLKTEQAFLQPGALAAEGSRWNVKHHQSIVIKPIVSLNQHTQNKDCKVPLTVLGNVQMSGRRVPCSPIESMSQENIATKDCRDQLDHRTTVPNEANIDCSSTSVLMSPEASPCNSDGGESRTQDGWDNATVSKSSLRCYRKHKDSASLQSTDWKSRRSHASRSCSSSGSEDSSSSYSSSSSSSRSRSRSPPPKKRRRYRSRNSHHSRSSSRSSYGSCGRSRGRSSSASTSYSSRSYSTSYSRSRSRSRSRSPYSRRYDYYGNRANYRRRRVPQQECAIEERRVVYIGKIPGVMTRAELKHRFSVFGIIEECNIHFRDHGDNYGFVTYRYTEDAFTAIENGHKLRRPDELPFDLCFGGRRQFCKSNYADLDSNRGDYDPVKNKFDSLDFDTLLKQAQKSIRR